MINSINVRFFIYEDGDISEVSEREFVEYPGVITYERNTVFENGVSQICLTKSMDI